MLNKEEIKNGLLGGLECALLMGQAPSRFGKSRRAALRSFIIPLTLMPVTVLALWLMPQQELAGHSFNALLLLQVLRYALTGALYFGAVYWLARRFDRAGDFFRFVTATNWLVIPATAFMLPLSWFSFKNIYSPEELLVLSVVLMIYTSTYTAFMIKKVFRLPWEMACAITVYGLYLHSVSRDLTGLIGTII